MARSVRAHHPVETTWRPMWRLTWATLPLLTALVPSIGSAAPNAGPPTPEGPHPLLMVAPWILVAGAAVFAAFHARALVRRLAAEREEHARELDEARRELFVAFEHAAHGFALIAPNGRWLEVNDALCEMLGFTAEELQEADFQSLTHADDLAADIDGLKCLRTGELSRHYVEKRFLRKGGGEIWTEMTLLPVRDARRGVVRLVCHVHDLSARKAMETELSNAGSATGAAAARRFAHELNNFLTAVLGNLELAEDRAGEDERLGKLLATARRAAESASEATHDFHARARRASGSGS